MRRLLLTALALALCAAVPATAFYGNGATIVSASLQLLEQGDDASTQVDLSADGRYAVFTTRARNFFAPDDPDPPGNYRAGGIFRRNVDAGTLELVADGDLVRESDDQILTRGAINPSVSADGRFVSFSTVQRLAPADTNNNVDVYVRDMTRPIRSAGAYELISAQNGSSIPARYGPPAGGATPGGDFGSEVSVGAAISSDGNRVVFRTAEVTDLPATPLAATAPGQLLVRDRSAQSTSLMTVDRRSGDPAGGVRAQGVISPDGSTVAWVGVNAPNQAVFVTFENDDPTAATYLWRRVAAGPTRRITGAGDADDSSCNPGAFCPGVLIDFESASGNIAITPPALSADGNTVAYLTATDARGAPNAGNGTQGDLFITSMASGVSRKLATTELTREIQGDPDASRSIEGVAMSPDGNFLAVTTARTKYSFPALTQIGTRRPLAQQSDVYMIDLAARTIERATRSFSGGDTNGPAGTGLSVSSGGDRVAFTSSATNLFRGDANQKTDAFVAARTSETGAGAGGLLPFVEEDPVAPPLPPLGSRLSVRSKAGKGGRLVLTVTVPEPGTLTASVTARGKKKKKAKALAQARKTAPAAGKVSLTLKLKPPFDAQLRRKGKFPAKAAVSFVPTVSARRLTRTLNVVFTTTAKKKTRKPTRIG